MSDLIEFGPVQQKWVTLIPLMQQSVLFAAVRGPDGLRKHHPVKTIVRWYRRSILLSAFDRAVLHDPFCDGGGSFTGPFTAKIAFNIFGTLPRTHRELKEAFDQLRLVYLDHVDEIPHHYQLHLMHAAQIVGCHHPRAQTAKWWKDFYLMLVDDAHLNPETDQAMNLRLSDNCNAWKSREVKGAKS